MARASGVMPNLINGVSEQPSPVRLSSQHKTQVNAFSTVVGGLRKRNPSMRMGVLTSFPTAGAYYHTINRDSVERYKIAFEDDTIHAATLAGVAKTVNFADVLLTSLDAVVTTVDGSSIQIWQPAATTTFDVITTGISGDTVEVEESSTGAWAGEETVEATITTNTTTAITLTQGYYYRANCSIFSAGAITAVISYEDASYLQVVTDAATDIEVITVADYSFVVNKTITVAQGTAVADSRNPEALIHVTAGNYDRTYKIFVDDVLVAEMTTPKNIWTDESYASDAANEIQTPNIAEALMAGSGAMDHYYSSGRSNGIDLQENLTTDLGTTNYTFTRYNNVIHIARKDSTDFSIAVEVDENNSKHLMRAHKNFIQDFSDLPTNGPAGFGIKVQGDTSNAYDDYYVEFQKNSAEDGDGIWREVVGPGVLTTINPSTMPHQLTRETDGTFTFAQSTWGIRECGDVDTVPWPSFVGFTITGMVFYRNRLGIYSEESIILSRAGAYFDHFPETIITALDTDPIDVAITVNDISIVSQIAAFSDQLLLVSERAIFRLDGDELLTAQTVNVDTLIEYETDIDVKPSVAGARLFMGVSGEQSSQIEEFIYDEERGLSPPATTTDHCPGFVPANMTKLVSNGNHNIVACTSSDQTDRVYVYKYYWNGDKKLQSSWSYWSLSGAVILDVDFVSENLVVTVNRSGVVTNEQINCHEAWRDELPDTVVGLDQRITDAETTPVYAAGPDQTTFTLPYAADGVSIATRSTPYGVDIDVVSTSVNDVVVAGDYSAVDLYFGFTFETRIRLSELIPKSRNGESEQAMPVGKLVVQHFTFTVATTAYVSVEVSQLYRDTFTHVYTGPAIGSVENLVGIPATDWSPFRFPIMAPSKEIDIDIVSDSHQPFGILNAEWEGVLYRRRP